MPKSKYPKVDTHTIYKCVGCGWHKLDEDDGMPDRYDWMCGEDDDGNEYLECPGCGQKMSFDEGTDEQHI